VIEFTLATSGDMASRDVSPELTVGLSEGRPCGEGDLLHTRERVFDGRALAKGRPSVRLLLRHA
jgi:hypothetical protein